MELQWRKSARVVAYVDLVLTILSVTSAVIYVVYFCTEATSSENATEANIKNWTKTYDDNSTEDDDNDMLMFFAGLVFGLIIGIGVIWIVVSLLHVWACTLLLKATAEIRIPDYARNLKRARVWKYLNMTLLVFSIIVCIVQFIYDTKNISALFSPIVIRIGLEFIVWQFARELKTAAVEEKEPLSESEYCVL